MTGHDDGCKGGSVGRTDAHRKARARRGRDIVLVDDHTIEFSAGWVFFYESRDYLEGGTVSSALAGNAPLIVGKKDGAVHLTGTAR
jgi:hypothetical protein